MAETSNSVTSDTDSSQMESLDDVPFTALGLIGIIRSDEEFTEDAIEVMVKNLYGSIDLCDKNEQTALHHAVSVIKENFVNVLLKYNINVSRQDRAGNTALHYAIQANNDAIFRKLIEHNADVNVDNNVGFPPLHYAVREGKTEFIEVLLRNGADPNKRYVMFNTSFHEIHCVKNDSVESLELLLKFGADTEVRDAKGLSALHHACQGGVYAFVEKLLEYGAKIDAETPTLAGPRGKFTPLRYAAMSSQKEISRLLLQHGANPNCIDAKNFTPLLVAAQHSYPDIVDYLLEYGADVSMRNNQGQQALHRACICCRDSRMLLSLLKHGADPNSIANNGEVPVHGLLWKYCRAPVDEADTNDAELVEKLLILLNYGAHFNLRHDKNDNFSIANQLRDMEKLPQSLNLILEAADAINIYCDKGTLPSMLKSNSFKETLISMSAIPRTLKQQTRKQIRGIISQGGPLMDKVDLLPLPIVLKNYLLFQ